MCVRFTNYDNTAYMDHSEERHAQSCQHLISQTIQINWCSYCPTVISYILLSKPAVKCLISELMYQEQIMCDIDISVKAGTIKAYIL